MKSLVSAILAISLSSPALADPGTIRVRLETSAGPILLQLDAKAAPKTVVGFMAYVDDGRLDDTLFYRASRSKYVKGNGFVQGGIGTDVRRRLPSVPFESTAQTGLRHVNGALSMARGADPNLATCNFSIMVGTYAGLDARADSPGYAVFGRIDPASMPVVKRILAMHTQGGTGAMRGQMLAPPVKIVRAVRLDGVAKPSGRPKAWLIDLPQRKPR